MSHVNQLIDQINQVQIIADLSISDFSKGLFLFRSLNKVATFSLHDLSLI